MFNHSLPIIYRFFQSPFILRLAEIDEKPSEFEETRKNQVFDEFPIFAFCPHFGPVCIKVERESEISQRHHLLPVVLLNGEHTGPKH